MQVQIVQMNLCNQTHTHTHIGDWKLFVGPKLKFLAQIEALQENGGLASYGDLKMIEMLVIVLKNDLWFRLQC